MNANRFVKALLPIWIIESLLIGFQHVFGSDEVSFLSNVLLFISAVLLPFVAGIRVVRMGGSIFFAMAGGISISAVSLIVVAVSFTVSSAGYMAFLGAVLAMIMFSVVPQSLFSAIGGLLGRGTL